MPTAIGLQNWCSVTDFNIPKHKKIKILHTLYTVIIIAQVTASRVPSDVFGGCWAPCWIRPEWNNLLQQHTPWEGAPDTTRCWWYFHTSKRKLSHLVVRWHVSLVLSLENHGAVPALQSWTWAQGWVARSEHRDQHTSVQLCNFSLETKDLSHSHVPQTSEAASSNSLWCNLQFSALFSDCRQFVPFLLYIFSIVYYMQRYKSVIV